MLVVEQSKFNKLVLITGALIGNPGEYFGCPPISELEMEGENGKKLCRMALIIVFVLTLMFFFLIFKCLDPLDCEWSGNFTRACW